MSSMQLLLARVATLSLSATIAFGQTPTVESAMPAATPVSGTRAIAKDPLVEFDMMTWPEVKQALADGRTTALFYTGGTEQRGPLNANGGHNLMAKATVKRFFEMKVDYAVRQIRGFLGMPSNGTQPQ